MDSRSVIYHKEDAKVTITLNRPRSLNALNGKLVDELLSALRQAAEDSEVKVVILTGAGRAFCFGADLSEFTPQSGPQIPEAPLFLLQKAQEIIRLLVGMPKPTIAALNGFATGLGLDLALACDLRIAVERAKLGEAFVFMGLVPDGGGTFFLPRLVGLAKAAEMIFTGEPITSAEAERLGLINRAVSGDNFVKAIEGLADKLVGRPPLALTLAKRALWKNLHGDLDSALKIEAQSQEACLRSEDHREAVLAFREKRKPVFSGK
jgi:2-(1,2-epoxy-1,2-dihydrophenyl)acetyl-CoA isomerase